ncbi:MAG: OmpA family protein, partial [Aquihabitans sp.]
ALAPMRAYLTGGKLVLTGSVPDRRVADALLRRAGTIVGAAAVVDGMVVDPFASMPGDVAVHVAERVLFAPGSSAVSAEYLDLVESWRGVLAAYPSARMVVTGFTDGQGRTDVNARLSEARAQGVAGWMQARGVEADRFEARAMGAEAPSATNDTAAGRAENRRIQVDLVGLLTI